MITADLDIAVSSLRDLIGGARRIVPFTGAGISTECGIPDFRSPGGLWTKNRPIPFDDYMASVEARREAWRRRFAIEETFAKAKPGRGHLALASLYRAGKVTAVVTQNIDNLHRHPASRRTTSSSCTAIPATRSVLLAPGAMSWPTYARALKRPAKHPTATAAASSRPRPCRSVRRCRRMRWRARKNWLPIATCC